jgi:hypothetical protein
VGCRYRHMGVGCRNHRGVGDRSVPAQAIPISAGACEQLVDRPLCCGRIS